MVRRFRPARTSYSWAMHFAGVLAQRTEAAPAQAKRWRNEARPAHCESRTGAGAEATVLDCTPARENETVVNENECGGRVSAAGANAAARQNAKQWKVVDRSYCPETQ